MNGTLIIKVAATDLLVVFKGNLDSSFDDHLVVSASLLQIVVSVVAIALSLIFGAFDVVSVGRVVLAFEVPFIIVSKISSLRIIVGCGFAVVLNAAILASRAKQRVASRGDLQR